MLEINEIGKEEEEAFVIEAMHKAKAQEKLIKLIQKCKEHQDLSFLDNYDKSDWPEGLWQSEPDYERWIDEETEYECLILRSPLGTLNGYVSVPGTHPLDSKSEDEIQDLLEVHGGITWSSKDGTIPFFTKPTPYIVGFDCGHCTDIMPLLPLFDSKKLRNYATYKDMNFVKKECISLARQLKNLESIN